MAYNLKCHGHKSQGKTEQFFRLRENKEKWPLIAKCDPG